MNLARQVLEKALQLLGVPVGGGQELGWVELAFGERLDVVHLGDQLSRGSARPCPRRGSRLRARSARRDDRPPGTPGPGSIRCGRAARVRDRSIRCGPRAGPCARTRRCRRKRCPGCNSAIWGAAVVASTPRVSKLDRTGEATTGVPACGNSLVSPNGRARLGGRASAASISGPRVCLRRLERRGGLGNDSTDHRRRVPRRRGDRAGRPGGVLRLSGQPADDPADRGPEPRDRVARQRPALRHARGRRARSRAARRHRAEPALADLRGRDRGRGRDAGRRDGGHPRGADRRRRAHPAGADHRPRLGRGARRPPRPGALELRGPDRRRRRSPRLLPTARDPIGEPLGRGPSLRRRRAQPEGGPGAAAQARGPRRRRRGGVGPRGGIRVLREPGQPRGRGQSRRSRSWSSAWRPSRRTSSTSRATSPRASPWRGTSSATCASRAAAQRPS